MKIKGRNALKGSILIALTLFVFIVLTSAISSQSAQETSEILDKTLEMPTEFYQNLPNSQYLYPDSMNNPWTQTTWMKDYCNKTGMDFLVLIEPTACSPAIVRSDLLEEQDVPVLCRMTGVKINPLIQVPYIKSIIPTVENKSNEIGFVNFLPARVALSYAGTSDKTQASLEGVPTMNNLGYLWIQLKQQPSEEKMPSSVKANLSVKITYDVARTFGVNENQFVLPLLNQNDWLSRYKEFGFWRGKGYLRLQEITGLSSAKIAVYTNPNAAPIKIVELREGVMPSDKDEIMLPGFYCGAGLRLKLDKITTPTTRARLLVNGEELLLEENDVILDSGCRIGSLKASAGYGGSAVIYCATSRKELTIDDFEARIETDIPARTINTRVGDMITVKKDEQDKYLYVGFIGKEYNQDGFIDFVIMFYKKDFIKMSDTEKEKVVSLIHEYIKSKRGASLDINVMSESGWTEELNKLFESKGFTRDVHFFVRKTNADVAIPDINIPFKIISVTGPEQVSYTQEVENVYKDALQKWRDVAFAYSSKPSPEGAYYGVIALRNAADLAAYMHKNVDRAEILRELINKYASSEEPEVIAEVENAREDLRLAMSGGGNRKTSILTPTGSYEIELLAIEKPGVGTKEAQVEIDDIPSILTVDDEVDGWVVTEIDETKVVFKNLTNYEETIAVGSWKYLGEKKVRVASTTLKKEVKVTVLPFEKERSTIANFSVAIGIEKRAIKLSPEKTTELIAKLDKDIAQLETIRDNLGKIVTVWKKACFVGAGALWIKNFVTGLGGESYARKIVMEPWTEKCADPTYRQDIGAKSVSDCYRVKENEINNDIALVKNALKKTNNFISDVKSQEGVMTTGGLFGLSKTVNDKKFMAAAENRFKTLGLNNIEIYEEKELRRITEAEGPIELTINSKPERFDTIKELYEKYPNIDKSLTAKILNNKFDSNQISSSFTELYEKGYLSKNDVKEIVLNLELYKECKSKTQSELANSVLCQNTIKGSYGKLKEIAEELKESQTTSAFNNHFGFNPVIVKPKETVSLKAQIYTADSAYVNKLTYPQTVNEDSKLKIGEKFTSFYQLNAYYIAVVESAGQGRFTINRLFEVNTTGNVLNFYNSTTTPKTLADKLRELGISDIEAIDITLCNNNEMKSPYLNEIKFWESGVYQGFVAWMPIDKANGWYMATLGYTGMEDAMIAWKENADINTFWICNVGVDGIPNFDHSQGPRGDDCCTQIALVTGATPEIAGCTTPGCSSNLITRAKNCAAKAIKDYAAGNRKIITDCGSFSLGKPPAATPTTQCEDYMSPSDCRIMFNLCDPVMCPASRCDFGGRMPVENVVQSGIIGSLMLCWPNFEDGKGVLVPVCLTGVHAGVDSFIGILKSGRECLQEQLNSGKTIGICDEIMSVYKCEFFWKQIAPFLKAGLPSLTESLTNRGGGEYALFSESWKQSIKATQYFTDYYALNSIKAFKARSTREIGTEICKKYISATYPTQAQFWNELSQPESPTQATAWFDEIPMGTATPNSHYKVFVYIFAGRDQGVYYSIRLTGASQAGYYQIPEDYLVPNGFGYLPAGEYLSITPDFTAPSGYKEICIRLNEQEICGFGQASTSFALNELQNYYLQDQLRKEITTSKECVSGTPSIIPTATLNIQNYVERSLEPQLYKRGIIRICSTRNPGESTQNTDRYKKIGYCDNKNVGCYLDMNSVNESVSDLGIRANIINESNFKDIKNAIESLGLDDPDISQSRLDNADEKLNNIQTEVYNFINKVKSKTVEDLKKEETQNQFSNTINDINKKIQNLISEYRQISEKCARTDEKARAEFSIAKLYDLRARLYAQPEVYKITKQIEEAKQTKCEDLGGTWKDSCSTKYEQDKTSEVGEEDKNAHANKKCCVPVKKEKLTTFPLDIGKISLKLSKCYWTWNRNDHLFLTLGQKNDLDLNAIAGGQVIEVKTVKGTAFTETLAPYDAEITTITINHSGEFYSRYSGIMMSKVTEGEFIEENDIIAKVFAGQSFRFWIYDKDPTKNKINGKDPLCYFSKEIQDTFMEICKENIKKCQGYEAVPDLFSTWPVQEFNVTSCYGYRNLNGKDDFHDGIDIKSSNEEVKSIGAGTVYSVFSGCNENDRDCNGGYGNSVIIKHTPNLFSAYNHLEKVKVSKNQIVTAGQVIGISDCTGLCTGDHLDLKIYTSEDKIGKQDEGKHPLCFFSKEIRDQIIFTEDAMLNAKSYWNDNQKIAGGFCNPSTDFCRKVLKEAGLTHLIIECSGLNKDTCKQTLGCWWDSVDSKCKDCPDKCEGSREHNKGFLGLGLTDPFWTPPDLLFKTQSDCEKNSCGLLCLWWKDNKCHTKANEELTQINSKLSASMPEIQNVYIFSKSNSSKGFTFENKLVEYNDQNVEICAVVKINGELYSKYKIARDVNVYNGVPLSFKWYNIVPLQRPQFEGTTADSIYKIAGHEGNYDFIQYNQTELVNNNDWCINQSEVNPEYGTYWYRVEVNSNGKIISSLGKPIESLDELLNPMNINMNRYSGKESTLLEPGALAGNTGISPSVHRISRKSNYQETTCKQQGYDPEDARCKLIATMASFKNVPFAYGGTYYYYNGQKSHHVKDYIVIECLDLMVAALEQVTGQDGYDNFTKFITTNQIYTSNRHNGAKIEEQPLPTILNLKLPFNTNAPDSLKVGDIMFLKNDKGYTHTLVLYNDTNNNKTLDGEDLAYCATNSCIDEKRKGICVTRIGDLSKSANYTIVKINALNHQS